MWDQVKLEIDIHNLLRYVDKLFSIQERYNLYLVW